MAIATLSMICLVLLEEIISRQRTEVTMPLMLSRLLPVLIMSGKRAIVGNRAKEYGVVVRCINMMEAVPDLLNRSHIDEIRSFWMKSQIALWPKRNNELHDNLNIRSFQSFHAVSKEVLSTHYDDMMPMLISIVRERRSEELCHAAWTAIGRLGDAVSMDHFRPLFIQVSFACFIDDGNLCHFTSNEALELCLGCFDNKANVVISKECNSDNCTDCACRPYFCAECLARWFLESAPSVDQHAACPTCRASFCVKDVAIVSDEKE